MRNTGCIFANDASKQRAKALIGNIHRMGARNVICCAYDAREFPKVIGGFDRVLLDAPCSGTGVIGKDPSIKTNKTEKDFMQLPHLQKQLLLSAIDSVNHQSKTGGYLVYSTWCVRYTETVPAFCCVCQLLTDSHYSSVTVEENEAVVAYALSRRPNVKLVETGLTFGKEGFVSYQGKHFHDSLKLTRRFYPHHQNVDGFFVAKFQKTGPTPPNAVLADRSGNGKGGSKAASENGHGRREDGDAEMVDKSPIMADDDNTRQGDTGADDFGGFDEEEDEKYMERAKRNAMRKKGFNPKALDRKKKENGAERAEKGNR